MDYFVKNWKNYFLTCFNYGANNSPHFHQNYFSKEYYPIYVAFILYSIIYIVQYVLFGFLWERIIFDIILGCVLGIIIYFTEKYAQYTQLFFTIFFMIGTVLMDKLIIFGLKSYELLFLGIYISILYYNLIKGPNNFLSNIAFSFMLVYLSSLLLLNLEDLTTFFGNVTICLLQSYMTWTEHKNKLLIFEKQTNEKKMWMHIFNKIFPGITILFKKKVSIEKKISSKKRLKDLVHFEFVNTKAQKKYKIESNIDQIEELMADISILTNHHLELSFQNILNEKKIKEDDELIQKLGNEALKLKKNGDLSGVNLMDLVIKAVGDEGFNFSFENMILGYYRKMSKKMKIWITNFEWNNENLMLIHLDDDNLEEEIKKLQENDLKKNELLASVTHDLRSPLNGILAFVNNAKSSENKEDRSKFLNYAEINGKLLMSLINDILDYSSFLNDKFKLIQEDFSLNTTITEIINLMAIQAASKKITLKVENEFNEDVILFSDSRRLKQILINLIGNSIKFTMKGFIKLKILKTKYKNVLKFYVIDSGFGMKSETLNKIGKPYSTFDTDGGMNKYGIGLGLNICKKLISLLGPKEEINITSELGIGTKISFYLYVELNKKHNRDLNHLESKNKIKFLNTYSEEIKDHLAPLLSNLSPKIFLRSLNSRKITKMQTETTKLEAISTFSRELDSKFLTPKTKARSMIFNGNDSLLSEENKHFERKPLVLKEIKSLKEIIKKSSYSQKEEKNENENKKIDENLYFSSFGSLSNASDFEENPTEIISQKNYNFVKDPLKKIVDSHSLQSNNYENFFSKNFSISNDLNKPKTASFRILIADDNPFNAFVIVSYLKKIDRIKIYYDTACNGVECIQKFNEKNLIPNAEHFNLIFMDCLMPIKNGFEACSQIKTLIKTKIYHEAFIVGLTGLSGLEDEMKCMICGMDKFISKPITEKQCSDLIFQYMDKIII